MHERLRQHALSAWEAIQAGKANPLVELVKKDAALQEYIAVDELGKLMQAEAHLGNAPDRARQLAVSIRTQV
jgi:adenylosuccinate lyase